MSHNYDYSPPKRCLLIDDSATVRKVAKRLLQTFEYNVEEAENGLIGLEMCSRKMPDLVLLDWNMPVMNGIEFLRYLRREKGGAEVRVIFCTTLSDSAHIREAVAAGADDYIIKPFDSFTLRTKLDSLFAAAA